MLIHAVSEVLEAITMTEYGLLLVYISDSLTVLDLSVRNVLPLSTPNVGPNALARQKLSDQITAPPV